MAKRARDRSGEIVCRCGCYEFPHRWSGGGCTCERWVRRFFDPWRRECRGCHNRDEGECQVIEGIEETFHCPELRDYVRYEGVILYGAARKAFARATRAVARAA